MVLHTQKNHLITQKTPLAGNFLKVENRRKLYRTSTDKWLGGVLGGIAAYLDWDPALLRIGYLFLTLCSAAFPGIMAYIILWICMPREDATGS